MPSTKICKVVTTETNGVTSFAPEKPELVDPKAVNIHPDSNGQQWYWTPDDAAPES